MKIAGVGVNLKSLPKREVLIEQALKTKDFYQKRNAKQLIEKEIDASGLYNTNKTKDTKTRRSKSNRRVNNSE